VGIENNKWYSGNSAPTIYPNPVSLREDMIIDLKDGDFTNMEIYHSTGQLIYRRHLEQRFGSFTVPAVEVFSNTGLYLVRFQSGNGAFCAKVLVW
jgi:hypothetical protein